VVSSNTLVSRKLEDIMGIPWFTQRSDDGIWRRERASKKIEVSRIGACGREWGNGTLTHRRDQ
jgi:hypothetical protein